MSQDTETPGSAEDAETTEVARVVEDPDGYPSAEPGTIVLESRADDRSAGLSAQALDGDPTVGLSAEELLSIPPRADNLAEELAARPPRAKLPRVTLVLSAGILIAAGFVGGVLVEKHLGGSGTGTARAGSLASSFAAARGSGGGRGGFGGGTGGFGAGSGTGIGSGSSGGSITGSITVVSGNTLYITASNGTVYTVTTSGSTSVKISSSGSLTQLKPGQTVTISGTQGSGGTVNATTITAGN